MKQPIFLEQTLPTILIVDDTPANIGVIAENLEEHGYRVLVAQDGAEALQRADFAQPDLILLDVMMPEMDGFEVCRRLKKQPRTRDIPVIFMTARAETEDKVTGLNAGAVDYVTKPLQIEEVIARIQTQIKLSSMQKRLEIQNAQLQRYREQLEQRVAERTIELSDTNQRLRNEILERKRAEEALAASEREFRTLAENMPDNIVRYDLQGRKTYINSAMQRTLGEDPASLSGKTARETSLKRIVEMDQYEERVRQVLESGIADEFEMSVLHATDGMRVHNVRFIAERNEQGKIVGALAIGRDITERKEAENVLRASEEKYRTLVRKIQAGVIVHGADTQILTSNPVAQQILGLSEEQLHGKKAVDPGWHFFREDGSVASPDDYPVNKVLAMRAPLKNYILGVHRIGQGGDLWALVNAIPVFGKEGEITQVIVTFIDITERKRAERELLVLNSAVNTSSDAAYLMNEQGRFVYVNAAACKSLGYSREELLGMSPPDIDPDITEETFRQMLHGVFTVGISKPLMETRHRARDGRIFPIELTVSVLELEGARYCLTMVRDITERKRAEEELAEREQRYHEIFDNAVEGMYLLEVTEEGRFRNLDINPALAASTGIPREAMIGQFVDDTVPEEVGKQIVEKYRRCVEAGTSITESIELDLPTGKRYYISTITPIHYQGRIHRLIGISRDITELKKAERELQESREQLRGLTARRESAREEERKYIAREVHDELGQILTGLQLNVSVLEHKFAPDLPPLRDHLKETKVLTDKALSVARNVASALRPAALDMGINSALEWLTGRFGANTGIQCEVHVDENEIQIDESHAIALFRIVQESLTNVSRHAKATRVDVTFAKEADDYCLQVCDNGNGFEASTRKLDSFGLVGIKERALMLGGKVVIESSPGKGTQIEVRIPINKAESL